MESGVLKHLLIVILSLCTLFTQAQQQAGSPLSVYKHLKEKSIAGYRIFNPKDLESFYNTRSYETAWINMANYPDVFQRYCRIISKASEHGLSPDEYHLQEIIDLNGKINSEEDQAAVSDLLVITDILISDGLIRYGNHLYRGRFDQPGINPYYYSTKKEKDIPAILNQLASKGKSFDLFVSQVICNHPKYQVLQKEMIKVSGLNRQWATIPLNQKLAPGDTGKYTRLLNDRLVILGYLENTGQKDQFDQKTTDALLKFQEDHGLNETGLPDNDTKALLNITPKARIDKIRVALERWRWMPEYESGHSILVNIPSYSVHYINTGREVFSAKAIVGKTDRQTPLFTAALKTVVVNPYWHVPKSIAEEELFPKIRNNPGYLTAHNMVLYKNGIRMENNELGSNAPDLYNYSIKQLPGPGNSLGKVKFLFPNSNNVYLHDTPEKKLFNRNVRTFSHGCVRMEEPEKLARLLIPDTTRLKSAFEGGEETVFQIKEEIPVYTLYFTAWVVNGKVQYYRDVYGLDTELLKQYSTVIPPSADMNVSRWYLSAGN